MPITADLAAKLEQVLDIPSQFWIRLESCYQKDKVRLTMDTGEN
jgi:plasmid maintenance system antidote protein VapI